ncbi:alpha/beta-hydrolase [Phlegmacium glaucopus]|nr:alpha/beta-hydrolase [Phlegmacium glaucopus]
MGPFTFFTVFCFLLPFTYTLPINDCPVRVVPPCQSPACPPLGLTTRQTPLGTASGIVDPAGAYRFPVKYASANRWASSTVATAWTLPNKSTNVTALPLACPQSDLNPSAYSEDCLSMILYVPTTLTSTSSASTLVWVHGGSFIVGSATGPGLDGSKLAIATNSVVAVIQYRLGALGFMAPSGATNLAVKDIVTALQFLHQVLPSFGGSLSKITLAGQSSGATMIRALLAVPSASSLFRSAILQSDPMNFGFLTTTTQATLQANFTGQINCGSTDTHCQNTLSLDTILNAQGNLFNIASTLDAAAGAGEPIRPVLDGSFITTPLDSTAPFPPVSKAVLLTSVANEAGPIIYGNFPNPLPEAAFSPICQATFLSTERTDIIVSSPFYLPVPSDGSVDARVQLQTLGTDYLWRCSGWTFARDWVQNGGTAYVGKYLVGATYPGNEAVPYCTQPGIVCHQDDIQIVFGTVLNPTSAQSSLTTEIQSRYKAFLTNDNPNADGVSTWNPASTGNVNLLLLGGSGQEPLGACVPGFWGQTVQYDYQFFNQ